MSSTSRFRAGVLAVALAVVTPAVLTGCSQVADVLHALPGQNADAQSSAPATPAPQTASGTATFDSAFTYDGSVSLSSQVADGLEVRLDVWAVNPKRTMEWTPTNDKEFGFAVNVVDHRVDEKAVLAQKRRVYVSSISIASQTAQASGQVSTPFQFSADPRTLVPSDTLRSDRGLLLNSFQGGLLVPTTTIRQLPTDTYGITLEFALTVAVEETANTESSFAQQTIYQYLPIAISPDGSEAAAQEATDPNGTGRAPGWGQGTDQG